MHLILHKTFNQIIDLITGYNIKESLKKTIQFDFLDRTYIEEYQRKKFNELIKVASTSDYYKNFSDKPLAEFPLIDREEYQKNDHKMRTKCNYPCQKRQSSGSTGKPVHLYVTRQMLLAKRVSHQKMLTWYGLNRESPEFKLGGFVEDFKTKVYYYLRNKRFYNSFRISDNTLPEIIKNFNRFKPSTLYGYPSSIHRFVGFARNNNIDLHQPSIIVTHAENLYKDIIKCLEEVFPDSKIVNQYWATEANIAETCPMGNLHIDEDTVICEVLNINDDGVGDLYVTNLFSFVVPIIRYKIGDRVRISDKICPCGRKTRIIDFIEGRERDCLELPDGRRFPFTAIDQFNFSENIQYFQIVYYRLQKKLLIRYIPIIKNAPINEERIRTIIQKQLGLLTEFACVENVELTKGGKMKRLIISN